jgi:hypothetical protein
VPSSSGTYCAPQRGESRSPTPPTRKLDSPKYLSYNGKGKSLPYKKNSKNTNRQRRSGHE